MAKEELTEQELMQAQSNGMNQAIDNSMDQEKDIKEGPDIQGSEEVFPNGPTKNQVENWKQQFGDVYLSEFEEETFIWRTLSRLEYKQLMNEGNASEWEGEERIIETCIIWPEDYTAEQISDGKAGIPSLLSDQIMAKSGFVAKTRAQKL